MPTQFLKQHMKNPNKDPSLKCTKHNHNLSTLLLLFQRCQKWKIFITGIELSILNKFQKLHINLKLSIILLRIRKKLELYSCFSLRTTRQPWNISTIWIKYLSRKKKIFWKNTQKRERLRQSSLSLTFKQYIKDSFNHHSSAKLRRDNWQSQNLLTWVSPENLNSLFTRSLTSGKK